MWHFTPDCIMWIYPYSFQNIIIVSPQKLCVLIHSNLSGRENISLDHKGKKMCPNWLRLWHLKELSLVILQLCSFWILNIVHVDSSFVKRQFNYISDLRNKWYSKQTALVECIPLPLLEIFYFHLDKARQIEWEKCKLSIIP